MALQAQISFKIAKKLLSAWDALVEEDWISGSVSYLN